MIQLRQINLVQFFLFHEDTLQVKNNVVIAGPNGHGKTTLLDAIQIAMLGADGRNQSFNAQSVSHKRKRSLRDYCLGVVGHPDKADRLEGQARNHALTYLSLVFADENMGSPITAGVCIEASSEEASHHFHGAFILPGVAFDAGDFIEITPEGRMPSLYRDFVEIAKRRCIEVGREAFLTTKRHEYQRELLTQICPFDRRPDPQAYAKAFIKSLTLKEADSIDDFVRNHLIDEAPIQVESFGRQLRQLKEFQEMIEDTQRRIAALSVIDKKYTRCERISVQMVCLDAAAATFAVERNSEGMDIAREKIDAKTGERLDAKRRLEEIKKHQDEATQLIRRYQAELDSNSVEQQRKLMAQELKTLQERLQRLMQPVSQHIQQVLAALHALRNDSESTLSNKIASCRQAYSAALEKLENEPHTAACVIQEQATARSEIAHRLGQRQDQLKQRQRDLNAQEEGLKGQIEAFNKHGVNVSPDTGRLLMALSKTGIKAKPVSSLVSISNEAWRPAIEGYLGSNRDALVIEDGKTRDAVQVLRSLDEEKRIYDVTIIQPRHLADFRPRIEQGLVADLLESQDALALKFVQRILGGLRQAETLQELEDMPLALTQDGMLSKGGGTKRIRVKHQSECRMGLAFDGDRSALENEVLQLSQAKRQLQQDTKAVTEPLTRFLTAEAAVENDAAFDNIKLAHQETISTQDQLSKLDTKELDAVNTKLSQLKESFEARTESIEQSNQAIGGLNTEIAELEKTLKEHEDAANILSTRESELRKIPRFEPEEYAKIIEKMEEQHPDDCSARIQGCQDRNVRIQNELINLTADARNELGAYVGRDHMSLETQEALSHWEKGKNWVGSELLILKGTRLAEQENNIHEAKRKAEASFQTDIVSKLQESFKRTKADLSDLNRMLQKCPPFSGNERYHFRADPVADKKPMYDFIERFTGEYDLISTNDPAVEAEIKALISAASDPDTFAAAAKNLTDPLSFFAFDLDIKVNGEIVDKMSKRQGAGSNGEHRTPMYVAAGAALARAYRLTGDSHSGVMLLDEAFFGMDSTNAHATATFLSGLGLQLIMAAPEADIPKLMPVCTTLYEVDREGLDIDLQMTELHKETHDLMISDSHHHHPHLLDEEVNRLRSMGAS